jgi:hypothetical protein
MKWLSAARSPGNPIPENAMTPPHLSYSIAEEIKVKDNTATLKIENPGKKCVLMTVTITVGEEQIIPNRLSETRSVHYLRYAGYPA